MGSRSIEEMALSGEFDAPLVTKEGYLNGMRYFAAGCTVITAQHGSERAGLTVTAMCSVTAEPPRLLVCINRKVRAHGLIVAASALAVNVLSRSQEPIAKRFAGMVEGVEGDERFAQGTWTLGLTGSPMLADALVGFDCRVVEAVEASTHSIFVCEVVGVATDEEEGIPLLYFNGRFASPAEGVG